MGYMDLSDLITLLLNFIKLNKVIRSEVFLIDLLLLLRLFRKKNKV